MVSSVLDRHGLDKNPGDKGATYLCDNEVQIARRDGLTIQQSRAFSPRNPANTPTRLLDHHHLLYHLLLIGIQEVGKLLRTKARIKLQEAAQSGDLRLGSNVREEELEVSVGGVELGSGLGGFRVSGRGWCNEVLEGDGVVVGRGVGSDELGASVEEELFERSQSVVASPRHLGILLSEPLLRNVGDVVVQSAGRESVTNGEQGVHPVCGFADLVVLVAASVVLLHAHDEVENGDECADCVGESAEHDVAESDIVVGSDMACSDSGERVLVSRSMEWVDLKTDLAYLLVELNVIHDLQSEGEVSKEDMDTQKPDDAEVSEQAVEWALAIFSNDLSDLLRRFAFALSRDVLVDLRLLHEGVEDVEDAVRAPNRTTLCEHNQLVVGLVLGF